MLFTEQKEHLEQKALIELRGRFKRKLETSRAGKKFWAQPNFQQTTFPPTASESPDTTYIELEDGYYVLAREHSAFRLTGEYVVTWQVRHDRTHNLK